MNDNPLGVATVVFALACAGAHVISLAMPPRKKF